MNQLNIYKFFTELKNRNLKNESTHFPHSDRHVNLSSQRRPNFVRKKIER